MENQTKLTMPGSVALAPVGSVGQYSLRLQEHERLRERDRERRREEARRRDQRTISEWLYSGCHCEYTPGTS